MLTLNKVTILKILISVGVLAIAPSLYIQYGAPYMRERSFQALDEKRISDFDMLDKTIRTILKRNTVTTLGAPKTVYISIPSTNENCSDLQLPALADGWSYHCVSVDALQKTDGTGWIPINVKDFYITQVTTLPIDPINKAATLNYYAFVTDKQTSNNAIAQYAVATVLDSKKYITAKNENDVDPIRYTIGNNFDTWTSAQGLIGSWTLHDTDTNVPDISPLRNNGKATDTLKQKNNALYFSKGGYVTISDNPTLNELGGQIKNYSVYTGFKTNTAADQSLSEKWIGDTYPFSFRGPSPELRFGTYDGKNNSVAVANDNYADNQWHFAVGTRDQTAMSIRLYVDGELASQVIDKTEKPTANTGAFPIGARDLNSQNGFTGYISNFAIYARILSANEIERLYTALRIHAPSH